ncbi:hypothetical protein T492DRAFT_843151 [Pavlovales sp. CCMP2436]|nr:hypothetical protein T492DRAFT_843151 [Pavlovales sp. CCMP2436]
MIISVIVYAVVFFWLVALAFGAVAGSIPQIARLGHLCVRRGEERPSHRVREVDEGLHVQPAFARRLVGLAVLWRPAQVLRFSVFVLTKSVTHQALSTRRSASRATRVKKARAAPMRRARPVATKSFASRVKKVILAVAEHRQTYPVSLYSSSVGVRTCPGYTFNPVNGNRNGLWLPLIVNGSQFPSQGNDRNQYIGKEYLCQSLNYHVNFDWPLWGAGYLPWKISLVKMAQRRAVITAPAFETLISLYPYSQTANGTGYVKMTENVIGKMNPDFGTVVWTKRVPCHKDTLALGTASGFGTRSYSRMLATSGTAEYAQNQTQQGRRTSMSFSIPIKRKIYDDNGGSVVDERFPKYRLFLYQANCIGYPQVNTDSVAPTCVVDDIVCYMKFVDP